MALAGAGCGSFHTYCTRPDLPPASADDVEVTFLGVGGYLIRYRQQAVMTAPLYSNPTIGEIATQPSYSDWRLIDARLPPVADVAAILSGHSHYDHLMDVPYVAIRRAPQAKVYGNDVMLKLLAPLSAAAKPLQNRLHSLEPLARDAESLRCQAECQDAAARFSVPIAPRVRVWPIISEHSSQFTVPLLPRGWFPPVHLWRGDLFEDRKELPARAGEWVEGTVLAYLVDFLDADGSVAFRIYYQDSGTRRPYGFPPACVLAERAVDLALLCTGGSSTLDDHPAAIVRALKPRFTLAGHWDDFLNPRPLPLPGTGPCGTPGRPCQERVNEVRGASVETFLAALHSNLPATAAYALPCPDGVVRFRRQGQEWVALDDQSSERWSYGRGRAAKGPASDHCP